MIYEELIRLKNILDKIRKEASYIGDEDIIEDAKEGLRIVKKHIPYNTSAPAESFSLCHKCWCMTKTFEDYCGKCGAKKGDKK